jgi:hypothetical protein
MPNNPQISYKNLTQKLKVKSIHSIPLFAIYLSPYFNLNYGMIMTIGCYD